MRIFHHYEKWECWKRGMYSKRNDKSNVARCANLLSDSKEFRAACFSVVNNWRISSEYFLSDKSINRKAWIGQAACCIQLDCTENETKTAWNTLTTEIQARANQIAQDVINEYYHQLNN